MELSEGLTGISPMKPTKSLVADGAWQVPPEERPKGWEAIYLPAPRDPWNKPHKAGISKAKLSLEDRAAAMRERQAKQNTQPANTQAPAEQRGTPKVECSDPAPLKNENPRKLLVPIESPDDELEIPASVFRPLICEGAGNLGAANPGKPTTETKPPAPAVRTSISLDRDCVAMLEQIVAGLRQQLGNLDGDLAAVQRVIGLLEKQSER